MQAFKVYFQIIRKNLIILMIYVVVFLLLAVATTNFSSPQGAVQFSSTKSRIAVINDDTDSALTKGLVEYLGENAVIVAVKTDKQSLLDALFFRDVEYILHIPEGFAKNLLAGGKDTLLEKTTAPGSTVGVQMDFLVSRYLNLAKTYSAALPQISQQDMVEQVNKDLKQTAEVSLADAKAVPESSGPYSYFIYLAYSVMAVMILGVTSIMIVFNNREIKRRNLSSPISPLRLNVQLVLGNIVFSLAVWGIFSLFAFVMYPQRMLEANAVMVVINALVFTLVCLSISFFVGTLITGRNAQMAVANVLSLGLSFISGVFVPQEVLGDTVLKIASFTPTYWYVNSILSLKTIADASSVLYGILIQLGFAAAFFIISLVIAKKKSVSNE